MNILFGISFTINILLIVSIIVYFKLKKKYGFIFDMFKPLINDKNDDSIIDEPFAKSFWGNDITK